MRYIILAVVLLARVCVAYGSYACATVPFAVGSSPGLEVRSGLEFAVRTGLAEPGPLLEAGELSLHGSLFGMGLFAGVGYEQLAPDPRLPPLHAAYLSAGATFDPLVFAGRDVSRWVHLPLGGGGRLGVATRGGIVDLRSAAFATAALQVRLSSAEFAPTVGVSYRYEKVRSPDVGAAHQLLFAIQVTPWAEKR